MELLVVLIAGCVLAIPVIAIVALVKTKSLREQLEQQAYRVLKLEAELSDVRREVAKTAAAHARGERSEQAPAPVAAVRVEQTHAAADPVIRTADVPHDVRVTVDGFVYSPKKVEGIEEKAAPHAELAGEAPRPVVPPIEEIPAAAVPVAAEPAATPLPPLPDARPEPRKWETPPVPVLAAKASKEPALPRRTWRERLGTALPLEEVLGMNFFAKIGITLLALGVAFWGRLALETMAPAERVLILYGVAVGMLGAGVWLERRERYRLVGRMAIGGGWALLFFTTFALHNVGAMTVLASNTLDCVLMLAVAAGMVAHTLKYESQLVTGTAFLLAFSTVALSQDTVYSLSAGVILAVGIAGIALRMGWFELEIFGIAASYGNHFYWLYKLYPEGMAGHAFPQFLPSAIILMLYWAVFRGSYIARTVRTPREESLSTVAALLNSIALLAVMKFQSTHPELAFYALLALGLVEFGLGQLPVTRRRRPAFVLLTVLGTILVFASVPFKFSGNNIALLWMIAAEVLLVAGITQKEKLFRRLGLLGGAVTGALILYAARGIVETRLTSSQTMTKDGILLLACSVLFYANALGLRRRWRTLFEGVEQPLATLQGYLGAATAFLGTWALFTGDWTAIAWAVLLLGAAWGKRRLEDNHLLAQAAAFAAAVAAAGFAQNLHILDPFPRHLATRIATLPLIALAFYAAAWLLRGSEDLRLHLKQFCLWAGTAALAALVWMEVKPTWVTLTWVIMAAALSLVGRRLRVVELALQEHLLAVLSTAMLSAMNLQAATALERYVPMGGAAAVLYAISRFCTLKDAPYARVAGWAHTWAATGLLAALAWHESPQPWLAVLWAGFALVLALADRWFGIEELPWQAHVLAVLAVARCAAVNLGETGKWHNVDLRLLTVVPVIAVLYALARWVRIPESGTAARHVYTWAAAGVFGWLLWAELQPVAVAVGLAVLGLALFEAGDWRDARQLRLQAYAFFATSFGRIFFVNLTAAAAPGEMLSPRVYTVVPLALIYFFVWSQMQSKKTDDAGGGWSPANLISYLGTASVVALIYFEARPEWIVAAWSVTALALLCVSLLMKKEVFLHQGELLAAGVVVRALAHNIYGGSYFTSTGWNGSIGVLSVTSALMLLALPPAFRLRKIFEGEDGLSQVVTALRHPEQVFFFAPSLIMAFVIAVKLHPGLVTLAWGVEGLLMILLGLATSERSYRLAGLGLLSLCVGKVVARDAWRLEPRDRWITFTVLGAALTLVSTLYGRFRDTVRRLL
ncbi:MAG TPA: DUF2339 domain-containing protein [Terracidiphilus sp.]